MKGSAEDIMKEYGLILLILLIVALLVVIMFNYAATHGITGPNIPNPFGQ